MQSNWAVETLQVIRTLMERSALYRRALAPIMLSVGTLGIMTGLAGLFININSPQSFISLWLAASAGALIISFGLVRRQAIREHEPFWSPPTRRVACALAPPLSVGMLLTILTSVVPTPIQASALPGIWMILYGCALHSAGFFMVRGMRLLGWIFVLCGAVSLVIIGLPMGAELLERGHFLMATTFGGGHFACGVYLYFTEKKSAA